MRVLNFGSLNLDYVYAVDHFLKPGETLSARSRSVKHGGKGLNQSVALARAGAEVCHAGCVGRGGEELKATLVENNVDTAWLRPVDEMQGHTVIQVNREGENCILLYGGSNRCVTPGQVEETLSHFSGGDWLVLQNEISSLSEMIEEGARRGMCIVLNPSPYDERLRDIDLNKINWLLVNEVEAEQMTGESKPSKAWEWLHRRYPNLSLLVTLGSRGSMAFRVEHGNVEHFDQSAVIVKAVDTTGAGDTYTGYFVAGLMAGLPLEKCMLRASRAAAISVTRPGAADSIPWARELGIS